jgi:hypothetical protein
MRNSQMANSCTAETAFLKRLDAFAYCLVAASAKMVEVDIGRPKHGGPFDFSLALSHFDSTWPGDFWDE